jgi:hypothetical protein
MKEAMPFPVPVLTTGLLLHRPGLALLVDLPTGLDEVWMPLLADGADEAYTGAGVLGYLLLRKRATQRPGLTTFAAVAMRPEHDPPPNPATYQTLFQPLGPEVYAERLRLANALRG